ncbi:MAG: hypothetical protein MZV63_58225 [Marinilabiliales bacterium]|nr:hypothetical protein [Marinilabiliales bacterium]
MLSYPHPFREIPPRFPAGRAWLKWLFPHPSHCLTPMANYGGHRNFTKTADHPVDHLHRGLSGNRIPGANLIPSLPEAIRQYLSVTRLSK